MIMGVDDTITIARGEDQRTYFQGLPRVCVPEKKFHHGSTSDSLALQSPGPDMHVGLI